MARGLSTRRPLIISALVAVGCGCSIAVLKQGLLLNDAVKTATAPRRATTVLSSSSVGGSASLPSASSSLPSSWSDAKPPRLEPAPPIALLGHDSGDIGVRSVTGSTSSKGAAILANIVTEKVAGRTRQMKGRGHNEDSSRRRSPPLTTEERSVPANRPKRKRNREFYTTARIDRSGATINDMIFALAYGYARNATYMGACYDERNMIDGVRRQADKEALIRAIGLQDVLVFSCPDTNKKHRFLSWFDYRPRGLNLLTPDFLAWLRSRARRTPQASGRGSAVVHVRRGDIDPCNKWKDRYLPTSYYVDVLRRHVPTGVPVIVYSESASFEPFTEFTELESSGYSNVTIRLDTDLVEVWETIMAASYVVQSRSTFAYVPALLSAANATVLYPSKWAMEPLENWKQVETDIMRRSARRVRDLAAQRCMNYTSVKPGRSFYNSSRRQ